MRRTQSSSGFTIVELLIVIVVIAIIAAIAIFGYVGVQDRAVDSRLKSDLRNGSKVLGMGYASDGVYPTSAPTMAASEDTILQYTRLSPSSYCLTAESSSTGKALHLSNNSSFEPGPCSGHTVGEGGGSGGGSGGGDLYALATPAATRLKQIIDTLNGAPGQLSDYVVGSQADSETYDTSAVMSVFPGWSQENFMGPMGDRLTPTDPDGYRFSLWSVPHWNNVLIAYLHRGGADAASATGSSAVVLTPDGTPLSPYLAVYDDPSVADMFEPGNRLWAMQTFAAMLLQMVESGERTPATLDGAWIESNGMDALSVTHETPGNLWTIRLMDPDLIGFPVHAADCEVTLEAQGAQWVRATSYSCP